MAFLDSVLAADSEREAAAISEDQLSSLLASAHRCDRGIVSRAEARVARHPAATFIRTRRGRWVLQVDEARWGAGSFDTPTLAELEKRCREQPGCGDGRIAFSILDGASPLTDIGGLQATAPDGALYQVASQFNCLESPGPYVVSVSRYFGDATQGPRAAIGAFPATLLRHYSAPSQTGGRFEQESNGLQIELLASACGGGVTPGGYLTGQGIADPDEFAGTLEAGFPEIRVGVHSDVEVVLGFDWDGEVAENAAPIAQVMTSTVAGGYYGGEERFGPAAFETIARSLLRAAYLGTLLAAASAKRKWVVLTLIGGGVFANPVEWIWESILESLERVSSLLSTDLHVVLNGRDLSSRLDLDGVLAPTVERHSGRICHFTSAGLAAMRV